MIAGTKSSITVGAVSNGRSGRSSHAIAATRPPATGSPRAKDAMRFRLVVPSLPPRPGALQTLLARAAALREYLAGHARLVAGGVVGHAQVHSMSITKTLAVSKMRSRYRNAGVASASAATSISRETKVTWCSRSPRVKGRVTSGATTYASASG